MLTRGPAPQKVRDGNCPGCGTAQLAAGQTRCQACGVLDLLYARAAEAGPFPSRLAA
jgi:hypothetical protein